MLLILVISICLMVSLLNLNSAPKLSQLWLSATVSGNKTRHFHQNYTNLSFFRLLTHCLEPPRCHRWTRTGWVPALVWPSSTCSSSFNWWRCITPRAWEWWVALEEWTTFLVWECQAWGTYRAWQAWAWIWLWGCLLFLLYHPPHNSTSQLRKIRSNFLLVVLRLVRQNRT